MSQSLTEMTEQLKALLEGGTAPEPGGGGKRRPPAPAMQPAPAPAPPAAGTADDADDKDDEEEDDRPEANKASGDDVTLFTAESLKSMITEAVEAAVAAALAPVQQQLSEAGKSLDALTAYNTIMAQETIKSLGNLRTAPAAGMANFGVAGANRRPAASGGAAAASRMAPPPAPGGEITKAITELGEGYKALIDEGAAQQIGAVQREALVLPAMTQGVIGPGAAQHFVNHGSWPPGVNPIETAKAVKACAEEAAKAG